MSQDCKFQFFARANRDDYEHIGLPEDQKESILNDALASCGIYIDRSFEERGTKPQLDKRSRPWQIVPDVESDVDPPDPIVLGKGPNLDKFDDATYVAAQASGDMRVFVSDFRPDMIQTRKEMETYMTTNLSFAVTEYLDMCQDADDFDQYITDHKIGKPIPTTRKIPWELKYLSMKWAARCEKQISDIVTMHFTSLAAQALETHNRTVMLIGVSPWKEFDNFLKDNNLTLIPPDSLILPEILLLGDVSTIPVQATKCPVVIMLTSASSPTSTLSTICNKQHQRHTQWLTDDSNVYNKVFLNSDWVAQLRKHNGIGGQHRVKNLGEIVPFHRAKVKTKFGKRFMEVGNPYSFGLRVHVFVPYYPVLRGYKRFKLPHFWKDTDVTVAASQVLPSRYRGSNGIARQEDDHICHFAFEAVGDILHYRINIPCLLSIQTLPRPDYIKPGYVARGYGVWRNDRIVNPQVYTASDEIDLPVLGAWNATFCLLFQLFGGFEYITPYSVCGPKWIFHTGSPAELICSDVLDRTFLLPSIVRDGFVSRDMPMLRVPQYASTAWFELSSSCHGLVLL